MTTIRRITDISLLLVVATGAAALQVHETHLSSGYAPILRAAMTSSIEERAAHIQEARMAVRTAKDREVEADLEKVQKDFGDEMSAACKSFQYLGADKQEKFNREVEANQRVEPGAYAVVMSDDAPIKSNDAVLACIAAEERAKQSEGGRLWVELCATAGVPKKQCSKPDGSS
jgi:hypothetical protein